MEQNPVSRVRPFNESQNDQANSRLNRQQELNNGQGSQAMLNEQPRHRVRRAFIPLSQHQFRGDNGRARNQRYR